MFGVREYVASTRTGQFNSLLKLDFPYVLTQSFAPLVKSVASERFSKKYKQMTSSDDAGVSQAMELLDADPARRISGRENFRAWMQDLAERTIGELHGVHFEIPEPARRIEACLAPTGDGGVYYTGPSEDWSRPGRMWWSVPDGVDDFSTWQEVTTVYHEGVPGHHLQISASIARQDVLNRWQRLLCWVSGHGEGPSGQSSMIWLQVRDVRAEHARLTAAGVPVLRQPVLEPWGLTEMWIEDPDGTPIVLVEVPPDHPIRRDTRGFPDKGS